MYEVVTTTDATARLRSVLGLLEYVCGGEFLKPLSSAVAYLATSGADDALRVVAGEIELVARTLESSQREIHFFLTTYQRESRPASPPLDETEVLSHLQLGRSDIRFLEGAREVFGRVAATLLECVEVCNKPDVSAAEVSDSVRRASLELEEGSGKIHVAEAWVLRMLASTWNSTHAVDQDGRWV